MSDVDTGQPTQQQIMQAIQQQADARRQVAAPFGNLFGNGSMQGPNQTQAALQAQQYSDRARAVANRSNQAMTQSSAALGQYANETGRLQGMAANAANYGGQYDQMALQAAQMTPAQQLQAAQQYGQQYGQQAAQNSTQQAMNAARSAGMLGGQAALAAGQGAGGAYRQGLQAGAGQYTQQLNNQNQLIAQQAQNYAARQQAGEQLGLQAMNYGQTAAQGWQNVGQGWEQAGQGWANQGLGQQNLSQQALLAQQQQQQQQQQQALGAISELLKVAL